MKQSNPDASPIAVNEPLPVPATPGGYFSAMIVVCAAALVMAATIPGRTQGLALITNRLLSDFPQLTDDQFSWINFWATIIGGLFCVPCGWLLDRVAPKYIVLATMGTLALVTIGMSTATDARTLGIYITLTRGLGQSMLSVVSITLMAKWFRKDSSVAMGSYAVVMTMLMVVGFGLLQGKVVTAGWRPMWASLGWALLMMTPIAALFSWPVTAGRQAADAAAVPSGSASLRKALGTSCFWVFSLSISLFGLVSSGVSLYQVKIFDSIGLDEKVFHVCQLIGLGIGLLSNFITGWLARKTSLSFLLGLAMAVFAASLITLPLLRTPGQAYTQAVVHAFSGGAIVVLFYMIWVHSFGPKYVGEIQGAVQWMTVIASAFGPPVITEGRDLLGSYQAIIWLLSALAGALALAAFVTHVPVAKRGDWSVLDPMPTKGYGLSQEAN
ncbi:Major Facilitator Superfamily protein [Anatilimnocola aggregata]|uniref:Major Facilitator Superfamily protein n=1 Tax=Anatilimnocola aggregata TaxID=2528021 RepID=A0A517Y7Z7_9BACT|nr:MFS transporter [Anatilimnocola aggregata]QDU26360.1 Major Facilitator Superfamily protein [Anatilimnocola aggregata]